MKKAVFSLLTCVVLAGTSFAGTAVVSSGKEFKGPVAPVTCFGDTELQIDAFGTYNAARHQYNDGYGGGLGVNYFFLRYVGVGVDSTIYPGGAGGVWAFSSSVIARFPIDSICLAPYVLAGGGYSVDGHSFGTWHVGGGLEYRVIPNKLGIFGEGRYTWGAGNECDSAQARLGVRVVF
jgi:hypothetical protein